MLYLNLVVLTYYYYHHNFPTVADKTQWGCAYTEFSEDGIITVHLPISAKTLAITTNILKNSPSTPQAISNAFILNSNITNEFSICHNLGNQRYAVLYATISQL